jgi:squalene-hopene/tetraprenyl-beta-curcumene cyclase
MAASLSLERGTRFLLARQGHDGLWRDFLTPAGEASEWPTGLIATALHLAGADSSALERAAGTLVANQDEDGGWGYNENVPTDADSTACVLLFLAGLGHCGSACRRAATCLVRHQRRDGGVATYSEPGPIRRFMGVGRWMRFDGWCAPHTEVTAAAGRALMAATPDNGSPGADAAWSYVRSQQRDDGSWSSYWWTSPHFTTLQAVQLALSLGDHNPVTRAADWAMRNQEGDGAWSAPGAATSAFTTALSLSVLLGAKASGRQVERAISRLAALQDDDGGWPSHPIMRIPLPGDVDPDRRRRLRFGRFGRGVVVRDQYRTFTSAACVAALARARQTMG